MIYKKFPRVNDLFSVLGMGLLRLPVNEHNKVNIKKSTELILYAIDHNINYFDSAFTYKYQRLEPTIGKILYDNKIRNKIHIATKLPYVKSIKEAKEIFEVQLLSLRTDYIDVYELHGLNINSWYNMYNIGILDYLYSLKKSGKIKYIGFSFHDSLKIFKDIIDSFDWDLCQIQYNILDVDFQAGKAGLEYAYKKDVGIIIMEPLKSGILADRIKNKNIGRLTRKAGYNTKNIVDISIRWLLSQEKVGVILSGMNDKKQIDQNLKIINNISSYKKLTLEEIELAESIYKKYIDSIKIKCTGCRYCEGCPNNLDIPLYMREINVYWPDRDDLLYNVDIDMIRKCNNCGLCELKCPQKLKIRDYFKELLNHLEIK